MTDETGWACVDRADARRLSVMPARLLLSFVVLTLAVVAVGCPLTDDRRPTDAHADTSDAGR
jgi:hypothetical protein